MTLTSAPVNGPAAVAGIDGCRGRWLVTRRSGGPPPRRTTAELVDDLTPVVEDLRARRLGAVAVDMPIALLNAHPRNCDVAARRLLGPRRSSVFPAPVRAVLDLTDYDEARKVSREVARVAPSKQAFNLLGSIRHLDALVEPADQDRLVEAHPELAFARLAGRPLAWAKKSSDGQALRRQLLIEVDPDLEETLAELLDAGQRRVLPMVDLLDALVLTITADHVLAGTERRLPGHGSVPEVSSEASGAQPDLRQFDVLGRRAEITW